MVLSKTKGAPTPQVAASEISKDQKLMVARDMLVRLGMLQLGDNQATVTSQGEEVMRNQNLIDDSGALTPEGETYAGGGQASAQPKKLIPSLNKQPTE